MEIQESAYSLDAESASNTHRLRSLLLHLQTRENTHSAEITRDYSAVSGGEGRCCVCAKRRGRTGTGDVESVAEFRIRWEEGKLPLDPLASSCNSLPSYVCQAMDSFITSIGGCTRMMLLLIVRIIASDSLENESRTSAASTRKKNKVTWRPVIMTTVFLYG